ncbi:unnamed protein product [Brachionus calyciflorus]|uniref:NrS-1 polymerase-like helicase domain-containing protein n=1 Tax=Brachionus calyciflorus TaxID=104777 RepID=A0A813V2Q1_9BILA|nr:unnamed protein product [Brachionus calyciflorus]
MLSELFDLVEGVNRQNSFFIHVPCFRGQIDEIYDMFNDSVDKMGICIEHSSGPCNRCLDENLEKFRMDDYTRDYQLGQEINYDYELIHNYITCPTNSCDRAIVFRNIQREIMFDEADESFRNVNRNRPRISNGSNVNNYLITLPRCDLPKQYVFDGLFNLCSRLAVSKEKHTTTYIGYCCKNSSIQKDNLQPDQAQQPTTSRALLNTSTIESSNLFNQTHSQDTSNNKRPRDEIITTEVLQQIYNGTLANRNNIRLYKRPRSGTSSTPRIQTSDFSNQTNDRNEENSSQISLVQTGSHDSQENNSQPQSSFLNDTFFEQEQDNWLHCNSHLHIYAEFLEEFIVDFDKCKRIMQWCVSDYNAHIEPCKSPRNAIKYVTKEDQRPLLKNINSEECAFHKKMMDWIKTNPTYYFYDPFICSRPNLYKLITMAHADYYKKNPIEYSACRGLKRSVLDYNNNKTKLEVQNWYNECITNWRLKFPALYLWGESNTGKTTIIFDWLLAKKVNENQIYRPPRNCQFAWGDFNPREHLVVVMDEFEFSQFDFEEWKNIVEGRMTTVRVKGRPSKTIALKCPIIMISNYEPPNNRQEIINRIKIIKTEKLIDRNLF